MKYTKVPTDTFKHIQLNAGVLCTGFDLYTGEVTGLIGATNGGVNVSLVPTTKDFGEGIDNIPSNTYQLKKIESWSATMSGTFVTVTSATAKLLLSAATVSQSAEPPSGTTAAYTFKKITPNEQFQSTDFTTVWWVGDYSDDNSESTGKYIAIRMDKVASSAGFVIQSANKDKGSFAFNFAAHYDLEHPETIPFEAFVADIEAA